MFSVHRVNRKTWNVILKLDPRGDLANADVIGGLLNANSCWGRGVKMAKNLLT